MLKRIVTAGLAAILLASPALAVPKVVTLGSDATKDSDPVAACGALAASPDEEGWQDRGLSDMQIYLDGALPACEAALKAVPDSIDVMTWLGRVYVLVGRASEAAPLLNEAATGGDMFAAYLLSGLLGGTVINGVESDADRALALLTQAANAGFVPAANELAERYELGTGMDADPSEALRLYQLAADNGDAHALYKLGSFYQSGTGVTQDYPKAMTLFAQAADGGEPLGHDGVGQLYQYAQGVEMDYLEAAEAYQKGADLGEPRSETDLAYLYEQGLGVAQDYDKSFALLSDAADQGYGFAQAALSLHYLFGEGTGIDATKALDLAFAAVGKQVNYAQGIVGYMYSEGLGTGRDLSAALPYFQAGSDGGDQYSTDRIAVTNLEIACQDAAGSQYEPGGLGHGLDFSAINAKAAIAACKAAVEANPSSIGDKVWLARGYAKAKRFKDALPLLQAGTDVGNVLAQVSYADMLMGGTGVTKDPAGAVALYGLAAGKDFALAQYALGIVYASGTGVEADPLAARKLFQAALDSGIDDAQQQLDLLDSSGDPQTTAVDLTGFGREGPAY
ncbi:MAG: SEL1-like repeat protein [Devosia sp.]